MYTKLQRQKDFKGTQKPIQIMTTTRINLIINTKMRIKDKNTKYAKQKFK
jgi:hypothetical protein